MFYFIIKCYYNIRLPLSGQYEKRKCPGLPEDSVVFLVLSRVSGQH